MRGPSRSRPDRSRRAWSRASRPSSPGIAKARPRYQGICHRRTQIRRASLAWRLLGSGNEPTHEQGGSMSNACAVTGLFHVLVKTNDLPQTLKFYKEILGLREAK